MKGRESRSKPGK